MRRTVSGVLLAAVLLTACDDGGSADLDTAGDTADTTTTSAPPATSTTAFAGATTPVSTPPGSPTSHLTDVRLAAQGPTDRIVFEFAERVPGHEVRYVERPVREDGSGDEVTVAGAAVLQVRLENARTARIDGERVEPTYEGPRRIRTDTRAVEEIVFAGDFESLVTWVAGVDRERPFAVSTLDSPPRLVIDVAAG